MQYELHSHRFSQHIFESEEEFRSLWDEVIWALEDVSDDDLIVEHLNSFSKRKSISKAINFTLRDRLERKGWRPESPIFKSPEYENERESTWRLDFAKETVSIEVAFNHGEATAWNFLKPVLASEKNHIRKAIDTKAGIVITATDEMKAAGGFDSACGTFSKFKKYLDALNPIVTVPILLVGLQRPSGFRVEHLRKVGRHWRGDVRPLRPLPQATLDRIRSSRGDDNRLLPPLNEGEPEPRQLEILA